MKWFFQFFAAPFFAASVALLGNYWLVTKPALSKDYTRMGVDILLEKDAPDHLRRLGRDLLDDNSPIPISESEQDQKLEYLLHNIPLADIEENGTWGDVLALTMVYIDWTREVRDLCADCVSEKYFKEKFGEAKLEVQSMATKSK